MNKKLIGIAVAVVLCIILTIIIRGKKENIKINTDVPVAEEIKLPEKDIIFKDIKFEGQSEEESHLLMETEKRETHPRFGNSEGILGEAE